MILPRCVCACVCVWACIEMRLYRDSNSGDDHRFSFQSKFQAINRYLRTTSKINVYNRVLVQYNSCVSAPDGNGISYHSTSNSVSLGSWFRWYSSNIFDQARKYRCGILDATVLAFLGRHYALRSVSVTADSYYSLVLRYWTPLLVTVHWPMSPTVCMYVCSSRSCPLKGVQYGFLGDAEVFMWCYICSLGIWRTVKITPSIRVNRRITWMMRRCDHSFGADRNTENSVKL